MGKDPVNITRLIRLNEKFSNAESYHKNMQKGSQVAEWHENKLKTANAPTKVPDNQKKMLTTRPPGTQSDMAAEMAAMRSTMLRERKDKLKYLFESERIMYEQELNAMGLAVDKYAY